MNVYDACKKDKSGIHEEETNTKDARDHLPCIPHGKLDPAMIHLHPAPNSGHRGSEHQSNAGYCSAEPRTVSECDDSEGETVLTLNPCPFLSFLIGWLIRRVQHYMFSLSHFCLPSPLHFTSSFLKFKGA